SGGPQSTLASPLAAKRSTIIRIVRHGAPDAFLPCRAAIVPPSPGLLRRGYPPSPPADRLAAAQGQPRAGAGGNCRGSAAYLPCRASDTWSIVAGIGTQ